MSITRYNIYAEDSPPSTMIDPLYKKHAWGILPFAHPTNRGLRIALVIETDNAVDPRKYMDSP
ncbi:MAG: hypothetical protein PUD22_10610, partial [Erysipelotrichaceae bacterium]|nr:hypothetical protein [Erysipelotrichaceae bacterium]